jgi:hypothetical protein
MKSSRQNSLNIVTQILDPDDSVLGLPLDWQDQR